jgi:uncharacterized protein (TIGR02271 family)
MENRRLTSPGERRSTVASDRLNANQQQEETVIPVMEERLDVHKRRIETDSGVRVAKTVDARNETVDVPLVKEDVEVERVAVNRPVDAPVAVRHEGDTMIIPIIEEVLFVEKRLVLKEEIRLTRRRQQVREPQRVTLRSEHASVERIGHDAVPQAGEHRVPPASESSSMDTDADLLEEKRLQDEQLRRGLTRTSAPE